MAKKKTHEEFVNEMQLKNPNITIIGKYENSTVKVECKCNKCGHIWKSLPNHLLDGHGCPECAKKTIAEKKLWSHDRFVRELQNVNKDITVIGTYVGTKHNIDVKCNKCGNLWSPKAETLLQGRGCRKCANKRIGHGGGGRIQLTQEEVVRRVREVNPNVEIIGKYVKRKGPIKTKCLVCGHIWSPSAGNLIAGYGCPNCNHGSTSYPEQFIYYSFVSILGEDSVVSRDIGTIGKELDIYIPSLHFAIEFGSWTWHKDRIDSDIEKIKLCKDIGITLVSIIDNCPNHFQDDRFYILNNKIRRNDEELYNIIRALFNRCGLEKSFAFLDFCEIDRLACTQSRKMTTREFEQKVKEKNPSIDIEVLGEYINSHTSIECKCKKCGYIWTPRPSELYRGGCPVCSGHKKPIYCYDLSDNLICVYDSMRIAAQSLSVSVSKIKHCCNTTGLIGNFRLAYVEGEN